MNAAAPQLSSSTPLPVRTSYREFLHGTGMFGLDEIERNCRDALMDAHQFYLDLTPSFSPLYPGLSAEQIRRLSLISYCLLRSLLAFDEVIDDSRAGQFRLALANYENAIRHLSDLFPGSARFWEAFAAIKARYHDAIDNERYRRSVSFSQEEFEELSWGKSAFVEVAVLMLGELSGCRKFDAQLTGSLKSLHIALQYIDDIKDFREDVARGQHTFVYAQTIELLRTQSREPGGMSADTLYKYMVLGGLAAKHCRMAQSRLGEAFEQVQGLPIPDYHAFLRGELSNTQRVLTETENLLARCRERLAVSRRTAAAFQGHLADAIKPACERALGFILAQRSSDGLWEDFRTDNGVGANWVSAYVCNALLDGGAPDELMRPCLEKLLALAPKRFSYNDGTPQDGDSSTFFIALASRTRDDALNQKLASWLAFNDVEGGWSTYLPSMIVPTERGQVLDAAGWVHSHVCVSSVATLVLARFVPSESARLAKCIQYLLNQQDLSGCWRSYWWASDVYATSFAIQALAHAPEALGTHGAIERACAWLIDMQDVSGTWGESDARPFFTALAVHALLSGSLREHSPAQSAVRQAVKWLLSAQAESGGWMNGRSMRIPHPTQIRAHEINKWRCSSNGYNTLVDETSGVFSAVTVWSALKRVERGIF